MHGFLGRSLGTRQVGVTLGVGRERVRQIAKERILTQRLRDEINALRSTLQEREDVSGIPSEITTFHVTDLELPNVVINHILRKGVTTLGQLVVLSPLQLLSWRQFGTKSLDMLRAELAKYGLRLKGD